MFCEIGSRHSPLYLDSGREPLQMQGESENSSQKRPDLAMNQKVVKLLGDSDYNRTAVPTP